MPLRLKTKDKLSKEQSTSSAPGDGLSKTNIEHARQNISLNLGVSGDGSKKSKKILLKRISSQCSFCGDRMDNIPEDSASNATFTVEKNKSKSSKENYVQSSQVINPQVLGKCRIKSHREKSKVSTKDKPPRKSTQKSLYADESKLVMNRDSCESNFNNVKDRTTYIRANSDAANETPTTSDNIKNQDLINNAMSLADIPPIELELTDYVNESNRLFNDLERQLNEIRRIREEEIKQASKVMQDLETKYKDLSYCLKSEANGKLTTIDDFRMHRNIFLKRFEEQQADIKQKYIFGHVERLRLLCEKYKQMEKTKRDLVSDAQNKIDTIQKLSNANNKLSLKSDGVLKYRLLHREIVQKLRISIKKNDDLKLENNELADIIQKNETEVVRLRTLLHHCKARVFLTAGASATATKQETVDLLKDLINFLNKIHIYKPTIPNTANSEQLEEDDIMTLPTPLVQLYKNEINMAVSSPLVIKRNYMRNESKRCDKASVQSTRTFVVINKNKFDNQNDIHVSNAEAVDSKQDFSLDEDELSSESSSEEYITCSENSQTTLASSKMLKHLSTKMSLPRTRESQLTLSKKSSVCLRKLRKAMGRISSKRHYELN